MSKGKSQQTYEETTIGDHIRQAIAHSVVSLVMYLSPIVFLLFMLSHKICFCISLVYIACIIFDNSHEQGGHPFQWVRNWVLFKWYAKSFPAKIVKETELDPTKNYIFGYHPHGLIAIGAYTNLALNVTGFDEIFPGIKNRLLSLKFNFYMPIVRELFLRGGVISSSKKSIVNALNKGPGYSVTVVVGGAAESTLSNPGKADLVLNNRFGFVKVAIQTGAQLVPVYSFGENHLVYIDQPTPGTFAFLIQTQIKKTLGFYFPTWRGRMFNIDGIGYMFRKVPLTTVVGAPIPVTKDPNPSLEKIQLLHKQYMAALKDLYDRNKSKYHPEPNIPIPEIQFKD